MQNLTEQEQQAIELAKQLEGEGCKVLVETRKRTIDIYVTRADTYQSIGCLSVDRSTGKIWNGLLIDIPASIKAIASKVCNGAFVRSSGQGKIIYRT